MLVIRIRVGTLEQRETCAAQRLFVAFKIQIYLTEFDILQIAQIDGGHVADRQICIGGTAALPLILAEIRRLIVCVLHRLQLVGRFHGYLKIHHGLRIQHKRVACFQIAHIHRQRFDVLARHIVRQQFPVRFIDAAIRFDERQIILITVVQRIGRIINLGIDAAQLRRTTIHADKFALPTAVIVGHLQNIIDDDVAGVTIIGCLHEHLIGIVFVQAGNVILHETAGMCAHGLADACLNRWQRRRRHRALGKQRIFCFRIGISVHVVQNVLPIVVRRENLLVKPAVSVVRITVGNGLLIATLIGRHVDAIAKD